MSYSFESRVRFSEAGEDGCLTLPGIMDYFQDVCTFQADSIHQGQRDLYKRGRVWVLSSWQVIVNRYPAYGEKIITTTYPYDLRGFLGLRNFSMDTSDGERIALANSYWSFLDIHTGLPVRLTPRDLEGYVVDEKLDMDYAPRKIELPGEMTFLEPFEVQKHHLDSNHHVNNCQYVYLAMEYLEERIKVKQIRTEYKAQGRLGDLFYPAVFIEKGKAFVAFYDKENNPYFLAELYYNAE